MWAWLDLNQRLSRYEQGVLTFELHARKVVEAVRLELTFLGCKPSFLPLKEAPRLKLLARWESNPPLLIWRQPFYRNTSHQKGDDLLDDPITPSRKPRGAVL